MSESTRRPESYVLTNGCHNCKKCFVLAEIDCETQFYCTHNAPTRPLCSSLASDDEAYSSRIMNPDQWLKESGREDEKDDIALWSHDYLEYKRAITRPMHDAWYEWSKGRQVKPWGKCDNFAERLILREGVKLEDLKNLDCPFKPYPGAKEEWEKADG